MPVALLKIPPPLVAALSLAGQQVLTRDLAVRSFPGRGPLAGGMAAAAGALATTAARSFRAHDTTLEPMDPSQARNLVTDGVFGRTRNPMYVGITALVAANAVRTGHLRAVLPVLGLFTWLDRVQIPAEERALTEKFGSPYSGYRRQVPRWL